MRTASLSLLLLTLVGASACSTSRDEWNSVRQARYDQQRDGIKNSGERARAELRRLDLSREQLETDIEVLTLKVRTLRDQRREKSATAAVAVAQLNAMEQDLAAAKVRAAEIDKKLAPLRALESLLAARTARTAELTAALGAEDQKIAAAEAQLKTRQAEVNTMTETLAKRTAALEWVIGGLKSAQNQSEQFFRPAVEPEKPVEAKDKATAGKKPVEQKDKAAAGKKPVEQSGKAAKAKKDC